MSHNHSLNMQRIASELPSLPVTLPPLPWRLSTVRAVGGLREVGFAPASDLLLLVASQGRGVLDGLTGERLARDDDDSLDWHDERELLAEGIGPLRGQRIRTAGLSGGGLANSTSDGWSLDTETFSWPYRSVILRRPDWYRLAAASQGCTVVARESELRAAGFSPTGRSLVVATSSEVSVFARL